MSLSSADQLQRFSFDDTPIRGEIAHINESFREVLKRHQYPAHISKVLGELMAATALMSASLKFKGRLTLQIRLPGNISLLQAETSDQGELRAIARYDVDQPESELVFEDGHLVMTIEPEQGQRYQGIISINAGNVAAALEDYFTQSEQLPTRFWLSANADSAAGLMLQKLPSQQTEADVDAWDRISHLASTVRPAELLELETEELLHRLYHEEVLRLHPAAALCFKCTCSRPRLADALHQLGYAELASMLAESAPISITCDFCQQHYEFSQADVDGLFPERNLH
ncbi:Hsp33 family molecular chaperone HslO [Parathalassolituus penaei]|uniref:33 kDa chaperonin n=1 Tax=Parathalassolituus penaei TaxID=2997323 RepID=A0A9X3ELR7_9GAMM|nr:Hsp33 family molecular chaperone HslO [Parathalassolituus penaei]MCY0964963.1 Hsp33 family molecular chaperone HslO [Parathalassolituus penaei]